MPITSAPTGHVLATATALALPLLAMPVLAQNAEAAAQPETTRVIVQFAGAPALADGHRLASHDPGVRAAARAAVGRAHQQRATADRTVLDRLRSRGVGMTVLESYTYGFNGAAMTVPVADLPTLRQTSGVVQVFPDRRVSIAAGSVQDAVAASGAPPTGPAQPSAQGSDGHGAVVAVIDTGVDYNDAELGSGFGPGHKVAAGYDYVDNDADPMDDNGHGTHVAGIIAGTGQGPGGVTGVAPGATLTAYKVLGADGTGDESTILEGLEAAIATDNPYRADIVNMSLGVHADSSDPLEQAAEAATKSGTVVVAAAGNDGPGEGSSTSPANAPDVLAVGASFGDVDLPDVSVVSPQPEQLRTNLLSGSANPPVGGETVRLVDVGNGSPDSYDGLDVAGAAVLMTYPTVFNYDADLAAAAAHGVAAVILSTPDYFSTGTPPPGSALAPDAARAADDGDPGSYPFVAVSTDGTTATTLHQELAAGEVRIHVGGQDADNVLASFSSHGPAADTYVSKPDLVAPGVQIRSTWLGGTHRLDTGTSMAAPQVAGAAALVRQAHADWTAAEISSALVSTARGLDGYDPTAVGAGLVNGAAAQGSTVLPTPWSARLGLAAMGRRATSQRSVQLQNLGDSAAHVTLRTTATTGDGTRVSVTPAAVVIPAGASRSVTISADGPSATTAYDAGGWIDGNVKTGSDESRLRIPYLMAVRPLVLHPTPDPTAGPETVEIYSEAPLTASPQLTVEDPGGQVSQVGAAPVSDHWWKATLPSNGPAGTYRVSATATTAAGPITGAEQFTRLGPTGSTPWESVGPVGDAGVTVTSPADPDVAYMIPSHPSNGLVQRTTDGGRTWTPIGSGVLNSAVNMAIAADPTDARTVYVAQDGGSQPWTGRVMVSHDSGATWSSLPLPDVSYRDVTVSGDGRTIAAVEWTGVVHWSTNGGASWSEADLPTTSNDIGQLGFSGTDLYVTAGPDLWKFPDLGSGVAPRVVYTQPGAFPNLTALGTRPGGVAVAGYDANLGGARTVAVSTDAGATWSSSTPSGTVVVSALDWAGEDLYASTSTQSWRMPAGSWTWAAVTGLPGGSRMFTRLGGVAVVSVAGRGLYASAADGSYHRIGTAATTINALGVSRGTDGKPRLVTGTPYGTYTTPVPDGAVTPEVRDWGLSGQENALGKNEVSMAVDPADPSVVYELQRNAFSRFDVEKSTDGGTSWRSIESSRTSANPYAIAVSPADPSYIYAAEQDALGYGVLVSTDGGSSWRRYATAGAVTTVLPDPRDATSLWLGGPDGLYRSIDGGRTESRIASGPVTSLAVDPSDPDRLTVGGNTLRTSDDGGLTLRPVQVDGGRMRVVALAYTGRNSLCAATSSYLDESGLPVGGRGVLCSFDGGRVWRNVTGALPTLDATGLAVSPDGRWLFVGTSGQGVYRAEVASLRR